MPSHLIDPSSAEAFPTPPHVPDRFWDKNRGSVRIEALLRSYADLERRLEETSHLPGLPDSHEGYVIQSRHSLLSSDPEVNRRLHGAGFTQDQAQLVYDLAAERVLPAIADLAAQFDAERHLSRLTDHFGGEEKWAEISRQLSAWGRGNLPPDVLDALGATFEGILALHRMMASGEPGMMRGSAGDSEAPTEDGLKKMVADPRYWRDKDPAFSDRVRKGFQRLYPGSA